MTSSLRILLRRGFKCSLLLGVLLVSQSCSSVERLMEEETVLDAKSVERFANLALDCLHQEYPNKISHVMQSDADSKAPRELSPVFYGCFDWHSAVHGHWLLVRLCRQFPEASFAEVAKAKLAKSFTAANVAGELSYLNAKGRTSFERPYGLAWLLQLASELREWDDPQAKIWSRNLEPLETEVAMRFKSWLPKLSHPIRTGEHSQTAFAFGLVLDWAKTVGDSEMESLVISRSLDYYLEDREWNLAFEPGGQDFLSPGLAEADLMRRILVPAEFADWLTKFLPGLGQKGGSTMKPETVTDATDGKLAHLDGLNLSRAWMLDGIEKGLPAADHRIDAIRIMTAKHRESGLAAVTGEHYEGGHWLGSFAVYLVTQRGLNR